MCVFEELCVARFLSFGILRFGREMECFRIVCWDQVQAMSTTVLVPISLTPRLLTSHVYIHSWQNSGRHSLLAVMKTDLGMFC